MWSLIQGSCVLLASCAIMLNMFCKDPSLTLATSGNVWYHPKSPSYMGRLHPKVVPFTGFLVYESIGITQLEVHEKEGNLSFQYKKGPWLKYFVQIHVPYGWNGNDKKGKMLDLRAEPPHIKLYRVFPSTTHASTSRQYILHSKLVYFHHSTLSPVCYYDWSLYTKIDHSTWWRSSQAQSASASPALSMQGTPKRFNRVQHWKWHRRLHQSD